LYSRESTFSQGFTSSSGSGGYKGTAGLPLLLRVAAAAGACEAHQGLLRDCAGAQLQQLACSITTAVNMQAAAVAAGTGGSSAAAAGDAGEAGGAGAAGKRGRVQGGSALGLQGGEVERLIARWAVWQAGLDDYTLSIIIFCLFLDVQYLKHTSKGSSRLCRSSSSCTLLHGLHTCTNFELAASRQLLAQLQEVVALDVW
jgi:hypothetical protein